MDKRQKIALTRLSYIHPYPAMIADALAVELAGSYVAPGQRILDPFCGTSRTIMAAAAKGATCYGVDVNPLAVLISQAKCSPASPRELAVALANSSYRKGLPVAALDLEPGRSVRWFSKNATQELIEIVDWLNTLDISPAAMRLFGVVLSATVREVSFCRKHQWKLHRMTARERKSHSVSPWRVFRRRADNLIAELERGNALSGRVTIYRGDATAISQDQRIARLDPFDVIFTSPPYGDSRTTVSYGDVSALCLGVLRHVHKLRLSFVAPVELDNRCLGGRCAKPIQTAAEVKPYWAGSANSPAFGRVNRFLNDLGEVCTQLDVVAAKRCRMIFVVSRRSVAGRRVYIDRFLTDTLGDLGFDLQSTKVRRIAGKKTPAAVDVKGASTSALMRTTMREEMIMVFGRGRCR